MAKNAFFLAIDQGTTSSRAIVFDQALRPITDSQQEFEQIYPSPGWVEHDPEQIWKTTLTTATQALSALTDDQKAQLTAMGITNQRETTLIWDRRTGEPIYNAIVWQDRRTAEQCERLKKELDASGRSALISEKTGLLLDPYFSATKIAWILDNVAGARAKAENGDLAFGTVDSFLIWRLTDGNVHATDATNASRTSLFNINTLQWDSELLELFRVPAAILPEVKQCADDYGSASFASISKDLPICGVAGDQQAAAIGQQCFSQGDVKSTYGTGCFMLVNTGKQCVRSRHRLLSTIAYQLKGETHYALEGSIFIAGAAIQWLRDGIKVIQHAADTENHALSLDDNQGVYLVPAFTGLGAPYWDPDARGAMFGLTRATGPAEISRAALESIAYLSHDLLQAVKEEGIELAEIKIDGGMVANSWFAQFLTDMLDLDVIRPAVLETTALGAAYLAAFGSGMLELDSSQPASEENPSIAPVDTATRFTPSMPKTQRTKLLDGWQDSVNRTLSRR